MKLIKDIEKLTDSRVLVYITGDRRGLETRISSEVIPLIFKHISKFGDVPKISLYIYTTGGVTISGYGIVNLIREYCEKFGVIIPFKSLSTGTLITLGADTIIMSKMGQLGPVDPSLEHPLGPSIPHPQNPAIKAIVPVNVEDVVSFFGLAKKEAKAESEKELITVMTTLANSVHPLVLGAINRARDEIRFLSKTLLTHHIKDEKRVDVIVKTLIEERFSHNYLIGRKEAKNVLGLNIVDVPCEVNDAIMKLFYEYNDLLKLDSPFNPEVELGSSKETLSIFHRGLVESIDLTHSYTTIREIKKVEMMLPGTTVPQVQYLQALKKEEWVENNAI